MKTFMQLRKIPFIKPSIFVGIEISDFLLISVAENYLCCLKTSC
jgi:hypothetical protein